VFQAPTADQVRLVGARGPEAIEPTSSTEDEPQPIEDEPPRVVRIDRPQDVLRQADAVDLPPTLAAGSTVCIVWAMSSGRPGPMSDDPFARALAQDPRDAPSRRPMPGCKATQLERATARQRCQARLRRALFVTT
jgi:hypothetical protein